MTFAWSWSAFRFNVFSLERFLLVFLLPLFSNGRLFPLFPLLSFPSISPLSSLLRAASSASRVVGRSSVVVGGSFGVVALRPGARSVFFAPYLSDGSAGSLSRRLAVSWPGRAASVRPGPVARRGRAGGALVARRSRGARARARARAAALRRFGPRRLPLGLLAVCPWGRRLAPGRARLPLRSDDQSRRPGDAQPPPSRALLSVCALLCENAAQNPTAGPRPGLGSGSRSGSRSRSGSGSESESGPKSRQR